MSRSRQRHIGLGPVLRKVKPAEHDALVLTALAEASPPVA